VNLLQIIIKTSTLKRLDVIFNTVEIIFVSEFKVIALDDGIFPRSHKVEIDSCKLLGVQYNLTFNFFNTILTDNS